MLNVKVIEPMLKWSMSSRQQVSGDAGQNRFFPARSLCGLAAPWSFKSAPSGQSPRVGVLRGTTSSSTLLILVITPEFAPDMKIIDLHVSAVAPVVVEVLALCCIRVALAPELQ